MKKIIGLLAVLMITTGVFGQKFIRSHSFTEYTGSAFPNTVEDWIRSGEDVGNYEWINYVHFIQNGKLYMLAYEPNEKYAHGVDRDIFLYSKDTSDVNSPWEIASECVMTSNWVNIYTYSEVDFFRSDKSRGSKGEVRIDGDKVYITIGLEVMTNGRQQINEPLTFGFQLNNSDGTYHKFVSYQQNYNAKGSTL